MDYEASDAEVKQAQIPHNLFISGLFLFDLLLTPAVIVLELGMLSMLIPLLCSSALIAFIYLRSKKHSSAFVDAHWQLAAKHGRWLMTGYGVSAALVLIAWLLSLTTHDPHMGRILWTALTRIALLPTLIMVMVTAVLEASAIGSAAKREAPSKGL
jgi:hypothetical protein